MDGKRFSEALLLVFTTLFALIIISKALGNSQNQETAPNRESSGLSRLHFDSCVTPEGGPGECKRLFQCIIENPHVEQLVYCLNGNNAYVCCPKQTSIDRPIRTESPASSSYHDNSMEYFFELVLAMLREKLGEDVPDYVSLFLQENPEFGSFHSVVPGFSLDNEQDRSSDIKFQESFLAEAFTTSGQQASHTIVKRAGMPLFQMPPTAYPRRTPSSPSSGRVIRFPSREYSPPIPPISVKGTRRPQFRRPSTASPRRVHSIASPGGRIRFPGSEHSPVPGSLDVDYNRRFTSGHISKVPMTPASVHTDNWGTVHQVDINVDGCGRRHFFQRRRQAAFGGFVLGGYGAKASDWPWMVSINVRNNWGPETFLCGGSIITRRHILSAAHCFNSKSGVTSQYVVVFGSIHRNPPSSSQSTKIDVFRVKIHEEYAEKQHYNDIAILTLVRDVEFDSYIAPVCLPAGDEGNLVRAYQRVTVTGWGQMSLGGADSETLRQANLKIVPLSHCRRAYRRVRDHSLPRGISSSMTCAGVSTGGVDACEMEVDGWKQTSNEGFEVTERGCYRGSNGGSYSGGRTGDSGGPLMMQLEGRWLQVGIVSFGYLCGLEDYPGVYTRVSSFIPWIKKAIAEGWGG